MGGCERVCEFESSMYQEIEKIKGSPKSFCYNRFVAQFLDVSAFSALELECKSDQLRFKDPKPFSGNHHQISQKGFLRHL